MSKVHVFWEGKKIWKKSPTLYFTLLTSLLTKSGVVFFKCGLLGIYKHFFFHLTVKFKYCEKDTKFEKISVWNYLSTKKGGIFPNFCGLRISEVYIFLWYMLKKLPRSLTFNYCRIKIILKCRSYQSCLSQISTLGLLA